MSKIYDHFPITEVLRCDNCGEFFENDKLHHSIRVDGLEYKGEFSREFTFCGSTCKNEWVAQNE